MSLGQMDTPRLPPEVTSLASRPSKFKRKHAGTQGEGKKSPLKPGGKPRELASTHTFEHLAEIKTGLTSFQRFHSLLMVPRKHAAGPSCWTKACPRAERWLAKPHLLSSRRFEVMDFFSGGSIAALFQRLILQPVSLYLSGRECRCCFV